MTACSLSPTNAKLWSYIYTETSISNQCTYIYYVYIRCVHDGLDFYSDEGTCRPSHFHLCSHSMIKAFEFSMYNRVALDFFSSASCTSLAHYPFLCKDLTASVSFFECTPTKEHLFLFLTNFNYRTQAALLLLSSFFFISNQGSAGSAIRGRISFPC